MFDNFFFLRKSCRLWDNVEKDCRTRQATDENMAHEHCMLDTYGHKHLLNMCNTYCFSTTTMVTQTRLNFTSYVRCLSFLFVWSLWIRKCPQGTSLPARSLFYFPYYFYRSYNSWILSIQSKCSHFFLLLFAWYESHLDCHTFVRPPQFLLLRTLISRTSTYILVLLSYMTRYYVCFI
jgi:hypothetical protein